MLGIVHRDTQIPFNTDESRYIPHHIYQIGGDQQGGRFGLHDSMSMSIRKEGGVRGRTCRISGDQIIFRHDFAIWETIDDASCFLGVPADTYVYRTGALHKVGHEVQERDL